MKTVTIEVPEGKEIKEIVFKDIETDMVEKFLLKRIEELTEEIENLLMLPIDFNYDPTEYKRKHILILKRELENYREHKHI